MLAFDDGRCRVFQGHVLDELAVLPADSVHCVVTSPPYWGLRDYKGLPDFTFGDGWVGQLGLEPTPDLYVAHMVEVFEAVRRVLRPDGTCWLNLGDCYCNTDKWGGGGPNTGKQTVSDDGDVPSWAVRAKKAPYGLKPKDLVGIPWRVAFALQAAGWWLRSDIVWAKPNPMPESVTDRPTRAHEYLFLLAKSERYYYDADAIREPHTHLTTGKPPGKEPAGWDMGPGSHRTLSGHPGRARDKTADDPHAGGRRQAPEPGEPGAFHAAGRNKRSVWTISTQPYPEAHFATFPPDLVRPCIQAGTSERGVCAMCGAGLERISSREEQPEAYPDRKYTREEHPTKRNLGARYQAELDANPIRTTGWEPGCDCKAADIVPAVVLDPFLGSGTTLEVAASLGRRGVGIEANPTYLPLIEKRLRQGVLL